MKDWLVFLGALATDFILVAAYCWLFYQFMWHPERIIRFWGKVCWAPFSLIFHAEGQRVLARTFPALGYFWTGTTGSAEKDANLQWRSGMYLRALFIFASVGWLLVILGVI